MEPIDPFVWSLVAIIAGGGAYCLAAMPWRSRRIDLYKLLSVALASVLIPNGIDLVYGSFHPSHLVSMVDKNGQVVHGDVNLTIDSLHRLDLALAGGVLVSLGTFGVAIELKRSFDHRRFNEPRWR